ncbi:hypothetical protein T492DRAFT_1043051 [Pavlovales sp. CCMP2436]|nr:hypothetical protein T492DRAFT_1043051 [Pavlovales sp. CCMP2436]
MSAHPEEDPTVEKRMTLLDTVLEANPYLNEAEKGVAKRTERVRYEITSKLAEVKALHARHASDALKRPPVEELLKLIREAMPSVDSAELGLTHEEAQRWWAELTDACRPVRPVARAPSGGKAAAAAAAAATARALANVVTTAELVQPIEALALTMAVVVADAPAAAHDPSKRQSRSIEWGEALESVSFEKLDFDEARFKELCVSGECVNI